MLCICLSLKRTNEKHLNTKFETYLSKIVFLSNLETNDGLLRKTLPTMGSLKRIVVLYALRTEVNNNLWSETKNRLINGREIGMFCAADNICI